jgi:preprotein translocase subunit SecG
MFNQDSKFFKGSFVLLSLFLILVMGLGDDCFARAGDGNIATYSGSFIVGILTLILAPFFLIYYIYISVLSRRKDKSNHKLLEQLAMKNKEWSPESIKQRIEECFLNIENAWSHQDQKAAKPYVSPNLYADHKERIKKMKEEGTRNVLKNPQLHKVKVVEVTDREGEESDCFWAHLNMSMIDYVVSLDDKTILSGRNDIPMYNDELWKFTLHKGKWVVDAINKKVTIETLYSFKSSTE